MKKIFQIYLIGEYSGMNWNAYLGVVLVVVISCKNREIIYSFRGHPTSVSPLLVFEEEDEENLKGAPLNR